MIWFYSNKTPWIGYLKAWILLNRYSSLRTRNINLEKTMLTSLTSFTRMYCKEAFCCQVDMLIFMLMAVSNNRVAVFRKIQVCLREGNVLCVLKLSMVFFKLLQRYWILQSCTSAAILCRINKLWGRFLGFPMQSMEILGLGALYAG